MAVSDVFYASSFRERQAEFETAVTSGTEEKVKSILQADPWLKNIPFANGKLPLHAAIDARREGIVRTLVAMHADPLAQDADHFDAFDHTAIGDVDTLAVTILESIKKEVPLIAQNVIRLSRKIAKIKDECSGIDVCSRACYPMFLNMLEENNQLPLENAIASHDLKEFLMLLVLGADPRLKTKDGTSLLHLALTTGQNDIVHKLLIEGLNPNEQDSDGKTLLCIAAKMGDMRSAYLLLAYGATCTEVEARLLITLAKTRDLHISSADKLLFVTTLAYLLARGCSNNTYLPYLVDLLGGTWMLYNQLPDICRSSTRIVTVLSLVGLKMLPVTQSVMQLVRTACAAVSAFSGIKAAYDNYSRNPLMAVTKGVVHAVNAFYSWSMFQASAASEYEESELIKSLQQCRNVTLDDITAVDSLPVDERMAWLVTHAHAVDCPPIVERTGWNCKTFDYKFRQASFRHHPDKTKESTSSIQAALNAVYAFWKERCQSVFQEEVRSNPEKVVYRLSSL